MVGLVVCRFLIPSGFFIFIISFRIKHFSKLNACISGHSNNMWHFLGTYMTPVLKKQLRSRDTLSNTPSNPRVSRIFWMAPKRRVETTILPTLSQWLSQLFRKWLKRQIIYSEFLVFQKEWQICLQSKRRKTCSNFPGLNFLANSWTSQVSKRMENY